MDAYAPPYVDLMAVTTVTMDSLLEEIKNLTNQVTCP